MSTNHHFLEFEQPVGEILAKIEELRMVTIDTDINVTDEISRLEHKLDDLRHRLYSNLDPWQIVQVARHPQRPHTLDFIEHLFTDFDELHGDRHFSDDAALVCGLARFHGKPVVVIGHEKGRKTQEKIKRNFGMARPEGYRKALRVMKLAEKFQLPIFTFIDTQGAYPGIGAEERNQSEAIARNLFEMTNLAVPIITTVTGEGGSGGALAIGVCDKLFMLQYSVYSVISPEGCASILWKSAEKASEAASIMGITAPRLEALGLIDRIIPEPEGGAHWDMPKTIDNMKLVLTEAFTQLKKLSLDELLRLRYNRLRHLK